MYDRNYVSTGNQNFGTLAPPLEPQILGVGVWNSFDVRRRSDDTSYVLSE